MTTAPPTVSVVVPAFRQAGLISHTLDSVLAQTWTDFELVVADHSSDDGTGEVLEGYRHEPRVRLLEPTPAGGGAPANWNRVSQAARGGLLKLLPGDDLLEPTALERQVAAFRDHPSASLVCSRRRIIDAGGRTLKRSHGMPRRWWGAHDGREVIAASVRAGRNVFGEPGSVMLRRDLLAGSGWWDDSKAYLIDQATYTRVVLAGHDAGLTTVVALGEVLGSFRVSSGQWSVALAGHQAAQAKAFHHELADVPHLLGRRDLVQGDATVSAMAVARQAVYSVLGLVRRD
ncbi:glycosyltransferase family 2 protein [Aestuariimicrobium sp. T2.26MG-19.2B]|uniref:glycosyltransferase family 2 protein n=1 Tax=Aestuariimicrobium sp. T2.26MG-19.2B TaxID=3040679 RepID=UPI0024777F0B|nr:glycosyltransferase family A protein [Aestuariimicrobium sp. T2.26MG-19.2B]CAI9410971.1 hypothetical protein AESSP_02551 [Aestuariimicrobium sp. T2.26MG-19.2B]